MPCFIFFHMTASSQKLKCHLSLQRSKLIFHYQADMSIRQTSCSVCDWLFIRLTNTHAANTNTYCTLLTCLSRDSAVVLFDYLPHMNPKTNVSAISTDAHTHTHTHTHSAIWLLHQLSADAQVGLYRNGALGVHGFMGV